MRMQKPSRQSQFLLLGLVAGIVVSILCYLGFSTVLQNDGSAGPPTTSAYSTGEENASDLDTSQTSFEPRIGSILEDLADLESGFAQSLVLYKFLNSASESELLDLLVLSKSIQRMSRRHDIQTAIFRKLTTLDPQIALDRIQEISRLEQEPMLVGVFEEWSIANLKSAVDAASKLKGSQRQTAIQTILRTRDDISETQQMDIVRTLGNATFQQELASFGKASALIGNPQEAWNLVVNDSVDDTLQSQLLARIAEIWTEREGIEVLSHVYEQEFIDWSLKTDIAVALVESNPEAALEYSLQLPEQERGWLSGLVARAWARMNPDAAFAAISERVPEGLRDSLLETVVFNWARSRPREIVEKAEMLEGKLRVTALENALSEIARTSPEEAIQQMNALSHLVANTTTLSTWIMYSWMDSDPVAAVEWVLSDFDPDDPHRLQLLDQAMASLAREDSEHAFKIAVGQPAMGNGWGLELHVLRHVASEGPVDDALEMLSQVRKNTQSESMAYPYSLVGRAMVDAKDFEQALSLAEDLPETDHRFYYQSITSEWAKVAPLDLFEKLEALPSDAIKSRAGISLINRNRSEPVLTDEQIGHVETFLSDEDKKLVERLKRM